MNLFKALYCRLFHTKCHYEVGEMGGGGFWDMKCSKCGNEWIQ
jgi:ribosomal protein S27E